MLLREHPLMSYKGIRSWPPIWLWTGGGKNKKPRGEVGTLLEVLQSNITSTNRCFLSIANDGSTYIGCLLIDDYAFCQYVTQVLQSCRNRSIAEIGSLDLSYLL